ncbi:MAG: SUMF1/EgtB/PvdO family nonheme iron enzyme [Pirellulaceae bacterium]
MIRPKLFALLAILVFASLADVSAQESKLDPSLADTTCKLELTLPEGATVTLAGKEYGSRRSFTYDSLEAGKTYDASVSVRLASGETVERAVKLRGGFRVTLDVKRPEADATRSAGPPRPVESPRAGGENASGRWALLIGVDDYTELGDLKFAGADMRALRERLIASGFPEKQVFLMHDDADESHYRPIRENIEKQLKLVLGLAEPGDVVLLAFSGHGVHLDGKSYLCPTQANLAKPDETMVPVDMFYQQLRTCPADLKLMLVDACRDDPRPPGRRSATPLPDKQQFNTSFERPPEGIVLLSSCRAGQVSLEEEDFGHGVFMHYVLEALSGKGDKDGDGKVSLGELSRYAGKETKVYVARKFNEFQTPGLRGDLSIEALDYPLSSAVAEPEITNSIGMKLKRIPAGEFLMGSGESAEAIARAFDSKPKNYEDEHPQHRVRITRPFHLATTEVTQGQWMAVMGTTPWKGEDYVKEGSDYPATYVSWDEAVEFCRKLSEKEGRTYRLPTEAEWEYACRGGSTTKYSFGASDTSLKDHAWFEVNAWDVDEKYAHSVGQKRANAFGLYDMHGNVWEWCQDWYGEDYYANSPGNDPRGPSEGSYRVYRGGGWSPAAWDCRSAFRSGYNPSLRISILGFRVALSPSGE